MIMGFHVHSSFSFDSQSSVRNIVRRCKKAGINCLAITDHNTIRGSVEAAKIKERDFHVIVGSEVATDKGDVIGLFLNSEIKSKEFYGAVDEIRSQGGMVILPHPFRYMRPLLNGADKKMLARVDAIERINYHDHPIAVYLSNKLARETRMPFVGGSDAHRVSEIDKVKTVVYGANDLEELRNSILKKRVKIMFSKSIYLSPLKKLAYRIG
jgi:predicted metal-dependent phosphoesterase TrpH